MNFSQVQGVGGASSKPLSSPAHLLTPVSLRPNIWQPPSSPRRYSHHAVSITRIASVHVVSQKFDPCTVTLADPVPARSPEHLIAEREEAEKRLDRRGSDNRLITLTIGSSIDHRARVTSPHRHRPREGSAPYLCGQGAQLSTARGRRLSSL